MTEWQSIETAPRDGRQILVFDGREFAVARFISWKDGTALWVVAYDKNDVICATARTLKCWTTLPESPE